MTVYLVPVGGDRYELYCEIAEPTETHDAGGSPGVLRRWYGEFRDTLRAAEGGRRRAESHSDVLASRSGARRFVRMIRDRLLRWVAEAIAEQRLLWHLRKERDAILVYPQDLDDDGAMAITRRSLQRDADRHGFWLIFDAVGLIVSGLFAIVPGPNLLAYYFAFRVVGHYVSRRGARHGLNRVAWRAEACEPLADLRQATLLPPSLRRQRVRDVASRLELEHLAAFFERTAVRSTRA